MCIRDRDHGGHPVLSWNIANVVLETDAAGNIKPSKARSKDRIDGAVALILAISRALLRELSLIHILRQFMNLFGLSPTARMRMHLPGEPEEDCELEA